MATWKNAFLLAIILVIIIGIILPEARLYIDGFLNGAKRLDLSFFYTPVEVYECLEAYGKKGRHVYKFVLLTLDFIFPLLYTLFFYILIILLLKHNYLEKYRWPLYLPFILLVCDIFESLGIIFLLVQYPIKYSIIIRLMAMVNVLKWALFGFIVLLIFSGGILLLTREVKEVVKKIKVEQEIRKSKL